MSSDLDPTPEPERRAQDEACRQRALTRAAKALVESLDLNTVLTRISQEAVTVLRADMAAVYRGSASEGVRIVTAHGLPPELIGYSMPPRMGIAGKVLQTGQTVYTNDYRREAEPPAGSPFRHVQAAVAVPMAWGGEPRGVLSVGFERPHVLVPEDVALIETFAELAAVACNNASMHAGLAQAARTDALTGCANHTALHETLQREIERTRRGLSAAPSVVLFDVDDFKAINDRHGHALGDEVLRRVGHGLRTGTREYDLAARYGGDEFALVCVEATEGEAAEIARRALERLGAAIGDVGGIGFGHATAGVAEWEPDLSPAELLNRAERGLVHGKQQGGRGDVHSFSGLPDWFRPGRFGRTRGRAQANVRPTAPPAWPEDPAEDATARLRARTRGLASAALLGTRLAVELDAGAIAATAAQALVDDFGWEAAAVIPRGVAEPLGAAGTWTAAGDGLATPVPVPGDDAAWGTLEVRGEQTGPDAARLLETIAAQIGAALEAARRHHDALGGG